MYRRTATLSITAALAIGGLSAGTANAAAPTDVFADSYTVRFFDDAILDLCGIETWTTLTERWTLKVYADGSEVFHDVRTFVPDDVRIPIEKGAGTRFTSPDGTSKVVGSPLRIFDRGGGMIVVGAGQVIFDPGGDPIRVRGQFPDLSDEALASYYCPASGG